MTGYILLKERKRKSLIPNNPVICNHLTFLKNNDFEKEEKIVIARVITFFLFLQKS